MIINEFTQRLQQISTVQMTTQEFLSYFNLNPKLTWPAQLEQLRNRDSVSWLDQFDSPKEIEKDICDDEYLSSEIEDDNQDSFTIYEITDQADCYLLLVE